MKKNIVIVHYNTPYLTECLVRSINLFVEDAIIYIFDNSDKNPFTAKFDNVTVLDNTKGGIIDFDKWLENYPDRTKSSAFRNNYASAKHCYSIQKCMELIEENFILLDSDVLLKKDVSNLIDENFVFVGGTEIWKARTPMLGSTPRAKTRAIPYMCFINTKMCKKHNIKYFNDKYMYGLSPNGDSYDTGSYFFEQFVKKGLKWRKINCNEYIAHYKAGAWVDSAKKYDNYNPISIEKWLEIHKNLWDFSNTEKLEKAEKEIRNKKAIYTCITGGYDSLLEPKYITDDFDYICFTDNNKLTSDVWQIRLLPKETEGLSQVKKQRYVKINAHKVLNEYDLSIWVDGNVEIKSNLNDFVNNTLTDDCSVYVPKHPSRNCIYAEAKVCISMKKDTKENIQPQIDRYKEEGFPVNYGLLQSNIMLRKHNDKDCIRLMECWFEEVKNGSHRDQLSFNYALWKNQDVKITYLDKNICKSSYFLWNAKHTKYKGKINNSTVPHVKDIDNQKNKFYTIIRNRMATNKIPIYY